MRCFREGAEGPEPNETGVAIPGAAAYRFSLSILVFLAALTLFAAACGAPGGDGDSEVGEGCPVRVEVLAHLGTANDPEGILGEADLYVVPLAGGGWAVLEPLRTRVLRYAPDGSFVGALGRTGQGPGELFRPRSLARSPGGELWITDAQGRWVSFDSEEGVVQTVQGPASVAMHGFESDEVVFTLHLAARMPGEGVYGESAFLALRWSLDGTALEPVGPGVGLLRDGVRVASSTSPHRLLYRAGQGYLLAANFEGWGPMASFPGTPAIHLWEEGTAARVLVEEGALIEAPGIPGRQRRPELLLQALGPSSEDDRFWAFGHLKRDGGPPGLQLPSGAEGTLRNSPDLRNRLYEGVAWQVRADGIVTCALALPAVPDGVVGPDAFFAVREDSLTGVRDISIWSLQRGAPEGAP